MALDHDSRLRIASPRVGWSPWALYDFGGQLIRQPLQELLVETPATQLPPLDAHRGLIFNRLRGSLPGAEADFF